MAVSRSEWSFLWRWVDRVGWDFYLDIEYGTFDGHFDILKEGVHFDIDSIDASDDYGSIFELDGDCLVLQLHQKSD